ncbi:TIGR03752 family integrating conjugative element protein [Billgrantia endophytica]|uniref:TIGR03752 family integrating conjugative element protein n=1 Tax=Billgrantia endophytica TaxID=2033802 RepID=A0A2N7U4A9_9GAMM|nr:TIGR03752 family integrating conjugative element protein [Halomonas endophytica]PMR75275.1 TIGR03752 family integrating conjugative element protein [Halomonas endophytica]
MKSNGLLKWLMIPLALLLVVVVVRLLSGNGPADDATPIEAAGQLTPDEMEALGIEGDTPHDTVATLVGQVRQLRGELESALTDNQAQQAENERLRQREGAIDQRINSALESERRQLQQDRERLTRERQQSETLLQDLQRRLDGLGDADEQADLPIGLGLQEGDGVEFGDDDVRWVEPDDARSAEDDEASGGFDFPTAFGPARTSLETTAGQVTDSAAEAVGSSTAQAVYTVPSNSTLMGSIAMTALIGRVPVDGTVNDPYPFKVLIGPDNLTANGIEIPDVAGAVVSGTASGDWTLSCVRGQIRSVTFVFQDGTLRTVPEDGERSGSRQQSGDNLQDGLGWISDPHGIPCVSGERRSNAQQYLGTQALITAAGAGAASLIDADSGRASYVGSDGAIGTVGISGNEAVGRILAGGVEDMSQWVNRLYGEAFAAVYVEPGARVAVHIEETLAIDYDTEARRVNHTLSTGAPHALDLD